MSFFISLSSSIEHRFISSDSLISSPSSDFKSHVILICPWYFRIDNVSQRFHHLSALKFLLKFLAQSGSSNFTKILKALNVSASYRGAVSGLTESCIINIRVLGSQPRNNTPYNRNQQEAAHLLPNRHRSAPSSFGFTNCWNFNYEVTFDHIFFISRFNIDTHQQKLSQNSYKPNLKPFSIMSKLDLPVTFSTLFSAFTLISLIFVGKSAISSTHVHLIAPNLPLSRVCDSAGIISGFIF